MYANILSPNEMPHGKTNKMVCAPSEDSDQPGHPPSLIKSLRCALIRKLRTQAFFMQTAKTLIRPGAQADWSLRCAHMPFCWFCHEVAQICLILAAMYAMVLRHTSHIMRKPVFVVCDQIRLKPACSATETRGIEKIFLFEEGIYCFIIKMTLGVFNLHFT